MAMDRRPLSRPSVPVQSPSRLSQVSRYTNPFAPRDRPSSILTPASPAIPSRRQSSLVPERALSPFGRAASRCSTSSLSSRHSSLTSISQQPSLAPSTAPSQSSISVSIRVRPNPDDHSDLWDISTENSTISTPDVGEFAFDNVFHGIIPNSDVYDKVVHDLVINSIEGFNGTVFAYGMTGSGKTHSMQGTDTDPGIIPLAIDSLFSLISTQPDRDFIVKVSYLEIYNEKLNDLLSPATLSEDLKLRDDPKTGEVKPAGLKELTVQHPQDVVSLIKQGDMLRRTSATDFNARSSRSHAVVQLRVSSTDKNSSEGFERYSTLSLCDLAGSERATTQTERRKEGAYINKSLLALGTVISKLSSLSTSQITNGNLSHIPYRNSKLTRLLQNALSGESLVRVLCTMHTNPSAFGETINTLRFAARAKNVAIHATRNEAITGAVDQKMVEKLQLQIERQREEIDQLKRVVTTNVSSSPLSSYTPTNSTDDNIKELAQAKSEIKLLQVQMEHLIRQNQSTELETSLLKSEVSSILTQLSTALEKHKDEVSDVGINASYAVKSVQELFKKQDKEIEDNKTYIGKLESDLYKQEAQRYSKLFVGFEDTENDNITLDTLQEVEETPAGDQTIIDNNITIEHGSGISSHSSTDSLSKVSEDSTSYNNSTLSQTTNATTNSVFGTPTILSTPLQSSLRIISTPAPSYEEERLTNLLKDKEEEIIELQESNKDKDQIIQALKSVRKVRDGLASFSQMGLKNIALISEGLRGKELQLMSQNPNGGFLADAFTTPKQKRLVHERVERNERPLSQITYDQLNVRLNEILEKS